MILADIPFQLTETTQFIMGLCGVLMILTLVFTVILQAKKLFGRVPPMDEQLDKRDKALRKMIFAAESHLKDAQKRSDARINKLEEHYEEMQLDRERKWAALTGENHELALKFAQLTGRIDVTLKKLEETKR